MNSYFYSAQYEALAFLYQITFFIFFGFLKYYEQFALHNWNPFGSYTPSTHNPRSAYAYVLTDNFNLGFDLWSFF
jgi:hypothetical protein